MRRLVSIVILLGIGPISLLAFQPVLAFPPLPSTFYGTVKVNGANVPDGTLVQTLINGKIIIETQTQTYQGDSFYSLDIPADDPDTLAIEGGQDGDTITFTIGGIVADQAGVWKSGTIFSLNLSASSAATLIPAQATFTLVPSQTAIILVGQTPTTLTTITLSAPEKPGLTQNSPLPTALMPPTPTISAGTKPQEDSAISRTTIIAIGIVLTGSIFLTILWFIFARKPKVE